MNKTVITLHDKRFALYLSETAIQEKIATIAAAIAKEKFTDPPLFLVVLAGGFMFASELLKKIDQNVEVRFIKVSSYSGMRSTGVVRVDGLDQLALAGRDVIIIEDLVDTGKTLFELQKLLLRQSPKSIRIATLLAKPGALAFDVSVDWVGFDIPNLFVVGFGIDYNELGRNYPNLYLLED